ncbi:MULTISPECIES: S8 family serine peptidase [unclassified Flavobacterium]|uniref:S8 family peptidase n=1 Tax=unclassified Flavobacterium TaxID=196869 RepID=UPI003F91677B
MKPIYYVLSIVLFFIGCKSIKNSNTSLALLKPKDELSQIAIQPWYQKDYLKDTVPGISLDKWYSQNKKKPKTKSIIVAVIDTQIDSNHEDLQGQIWTNLNEIPNNGIDDDHNGYIDDVHGWSFIGNKNGGYVVWANFENVRLVRDWAPYFKDKTESQIPIQELSTYKEYQRALKKTEQENVYYKRWQKSLIHSVAVYPMVKDTLKHFFPKEDYTYQQLDSMYQKYKINNKKYRQRRDDNDTDLGALIDFMMINIRSNEKSLEKIKESEIQLDSIISKNLNVNFNERTSIGDNPKLLEKGYGNNNISNNKAGYRPIQDHATKVSGIIAANRKNNKGINGIAQNVKIMPLNISSSGDEHDKDIAMAIRYAVDNGAQVINMSFGKEFSLHKKWVFEAFQYAEEHNVLLVHCSGNNGFNVDENPYFPSDIAYNGSKEVCGNFINVGSISSKLDSTFVSAFSNYGKQNVDLFAPGEEIYTTAAGNTYATDSGTSLAGPMVSGTAALIWSYYPNLSATEVKQIILDSGTAYDLEVIVPGTKDKKVPFSELSKSGKVLNVYDAMELAEKTSKKKR